MTRIVEPDLPPGPRSLKETGSPEWCWQTLGMLERYLANVDQTWRAASEVIGELESVTAWKVIGYPSFDQLCEEQLGVPAGVLRRRLDTETVVRDDPAAFIRTGLRHYSREQLLAALAP